MTETKITQIYTQAQITERVVEMGKEISEVYSKDKPLLAICVIKGAVLFYADLVKAIRDRECVSVSSPPARTTTPRATACARPARST